MSGFPASELALMTKRSRGICEGCGLVKATEAHHRQYRSRGGPDVAENGLHLCGWGNHTGCHGIAHTAEGEARGWSIRSGYNPVEVPARIILEGRQVYVRFTADGGREVIPDADAIEYLELIHARRAA
jgi:hypothetical protein